MVTIEENCRYTPQNGNKPWESPGSRFNSNLKSYDIYEIHL